MGKEYVGGDIGKIVAPDVYEVGAEGDRGSSTSYGGRIWKFLNDMKSTDRKISGNYDRFLKNVEKIFKKYSGNMAPDYNVVLCFQNPNFLEPFRKECNNYIKKGKDEKRKLKIKKLLEEDLKTFEDQITGNVFYDNAYLKEGRDMRRDTIDYKTVYLDGKAWKDTDTNIFKGKKSLEKVILGTHVKTISEGTFNDCSNLKEIEVKSDSLKVEKDAFKGCTKLKKSGIHGKKGAQAIIDVLAES